MMSSNETYISGPQLANGIEHLGTFYRCVGHELIYGFKVQRYRRKNYGFKTAGKSLHRI